MITVRNTDDHRRAWPSLLTVEGSVLVLEPGEEAELAEDPGEVAHLKVRGRRAKSGTIEPVTPTNGGS